MVEDMDVSPKAFICDVWFTQRLFTYVILCDLSAHRCYNIAELRTYFANPDLPAPGDVAAKLSEQCTPIASTIKNALSMTCRALGIGPCIFRHNELKGIIAALTHFQNTLNDNALGLTPDDEEILKASIFKNFINAFTTLDRILKHRRMDGFRHVSHLGQAEHLKLPSFRSVVGNDWPA